MNDTKFCPYCGQPVDSQNTFCPSCGKALKQNVPSPVSPSGKDKLTTALLALLLGGLGIQYFYLGKNSAGILCIVLTLCTCGIWSVVTLAQGIVMLTMDEAAFQAKYVDNPKSFPLF